MKRIIASIFTIWFLTSCVTAYKINSVSTGMTKSEVIEKLGIPTSTSAIGNVEFLNYKFAESLNDWDNRIRTEYYVKLIDGKVNSFGKLGDFDSTKDPTININTNSKIETKELKPDESNADKMYKELLNIKELLDKGILTQEEYEIKKKQILEKY